MIYMPCLCSHNTQLPAWSSLAYSSAIPQPTLIHTSWPGVACRAKGSWRKHTSFGPRKQKCSHYLPTKARPSPLGTGQDSKFHQLPESLNLLQLILPGRPLPASPPNHPPLGGTGGLCCFLHATWYLFLNRRRTSCFCCYKKFSCCNIKYF